MGFEHRTKKVLPFDRSIWRLLRFTAYTFFLLGVSLAIGVLGYHYLDNLSWVDALLNASMILTGMGPVNHLDNNALEVVRLGICYLQWHCISHHRCRIPVTGDTPVLSSAPCFACGYPQE